MSQPMFSMLTSHSCTSTYALPTVRLSHVLELLTAKLTLNSLTLSVKSQNHSITYIYHTISIQTLLLIYLLYTFHVHERSNISDFRNESILNVSFLFPTIPILQQAKTSTILLSLISFPLEVPPFQTHFLNKVIF